jgi:hypothetical protein
VVFAVSFAIFKVFLQYAKIFAICKITHKNALQFAKWFFVGCFANCKINAKSLCKLQKNLLHIAKLF